jgi:hypothetical protein
VAEPWRTAYRCPGCGSWDECQCELDDDDKDSGARVLGPDDEYGECGVLNPGWTTAAPTGEAQPHGRDADA